MAFDAGFLTVMSSTIASRAPSSTDAYGKSSWATSTSFRAKVSRVTRRIQSPGEQDIISTFTVWCPPPTYAVTISGTTYTTPTFTTAYQVEIESIWRPVVSVDAPYDEDGAVHHQKLMLGM